MMLSYDRRGLPNQYKKETIKLPVSTKIIWYTTITLSLIYTLLF